MIRLPAIALLMGISAPAAADWQFTRWGMSAAELLSVYKFASPTSPVERKEQTYPGYGSPSLKGAYAASGMEFQTFFYFDDKDRLRRVALRLLKNDDSERLTLLMKSQYRNPREQSERAGAGGCRYILKTWDDEVAMNEVVLNVSYCLDGHSATVIYSKRPEASETGL